MIETRGKGAKFHAEERILLLQGMRVILHNGKFAEILFSHVRHRPIDDSMGQIDEVHEEKKQVQVTLGAREGYVVSESEVSEEKNQKLTSSLESPMNWQGFKSSNSSLQSPMI